MKTESEAETIAAAQDFAVTLRGGDVALLRGDLGAGKSVFARAVIRSLCGDAHMAVPSPTFTLVQVYEGADFPIWHFDLYRLSAAEEVYALDWEEAISGGLVLVEWPERLGALKPRNAIEIRISSSHDHTDERVIEIERV